jgi:methionyl-tRNA formyltransferase
MGRLKMKFAYFGYREWAEKIFENLKKEEFDVDSFTIQNGEYKKIEKLGTKIINKKEIGNMNLKEYRALLFYGWSWIIPNEIVNNYESVCLHPSPLPKYRGGSPLQNQIINGEKKSAVTLFRMDDKTDSGPIYFQKEFCLEGKIEDLFGRIIKVGSKLTKKLLEDFENERIKTFPQNEKEATFYRRRKPEESELTPEKINNMTSEQIYNFIRSLGDPYPNAYIKGKDGKKVFLKDSNLESD